MTKFMIILGLILSWGGVALAIPPPGMEMPPGIGVPEVGVVPGLEVAVEEGTIVEILRGLFPEAVIEVEPITGVLVVTAPPAIQEKIGEIIERLDVYYHPQITIEAKFVELTVTDIKELGIETDIIDLIWEAKDLDLDIETTWLGFPADPDAWGLWHTRLAPTAFQVVLRALEKQGKVSVLSAPRVTTLSGQLATIAITETIPYVAGREVENIGTAADPIWLTTYEMGEEAAGIFLEVTPTVPAGSDLITLHLQPTVITLMDRIAVFPGIAREHGWPVIDERTTETNLTVRSGETIVLGGLIKSRDRVVEQKVPLLGDIPILGHLFRRTHSREEKKNLLIFVTAYLVSPRGERIVAGR